MGSIGTKWLSEHLAGLGFINVDYSFEYFSSIRRGEGLRVKISNPYTWDYNNGVAVVYDELGAPWIKAGHTTIRQVEALASDDDPLLRRLQRGAYVPHSNDGGHFVHEVLPKYVRRFDPLYGVGHIFTGLRGMF